MSSKTFNTLVRHTTPERQGIKFGRAARARAPQPPPPAERATPPSDGRPSNCTLLSPETSIHYQTLRCGKHALGREPGPNRSTNIHQSPNRTRHQAHPVQLPVQHEHTSLPTTTATTDGRPSQQKGKIYNLHNSAPTKIQTNATCANAAGVESTLSPSSSNFKLVSTAYSSIA